MLVYTRVLSSKAAVALTMNGSYPAVRVTQQREAVVLNFDSFGALDHFLFQVNAGLEDYSRKMIKSRTGSRGDAKKGGD